MVLISQRNAINGRITNTRSVLGPLVTGVACLLTGILIMIIDPVQLIVKYKLRLTKDSTYYELLQHEIVGARISMYLFNITNAESFLAGDDSKIRLEEVGPFVFQEYRWYEDLEISEDGKQMAMTPKTRTEFIPERSIAYPKDVNLTLLNLPMLGATNLLSEYPSFLQHVYNMMADQLHSKPIFNIDVHTYLWGYDNPLIKIVHNIAPGVVYFKKIGLLDRLYDTESDYRIVAGATDEDRFRIKYVKKTRRLEVDSTEDVDESELTFATDTYEGIGYPPMLTPDIPLNLYRIGICKSFKLEYIGRKPMEYGGEGLRYTLSNENFKSDVNSSKPYPEGLMDISNCFYGVPFMISKGHFLDADPKLLERIEGLKPDRNINANEVVIDHMVSVPFQTNFSIQLNIALDDVSYNRHTKRLSNTVLPITHIKIDQPEMPETIMNKFYLAFKLGPKLELGTFVVLTLTSLMLISHAGRVIYYNWTKNTRGMDFEINVNKKLLETKTIEGNSLKVDP